MPEKLPGRPEQEVSYINNGLVAPELPSENLAVKTLRATLLYNAAAEAKRGPDKDRAKIELAEYLANNDVRVAYGLSPRK